MLICDDVEPCRSSERMEDGRLVGLYYDNVAEVTMTRGFAYDAVTVLT